MSFYRRASSTNQEALSSTSACLDMNGLDFQTQLIQLGVRLPVVMITGYGDIPMSVRAMKRGAVDFLPLNHSAIRTC